MRSADGSRVALLDRMRISTRWIVICVATAASLVPRNAAAQDDRLPADKTLSPFFFVDGGDPAVDCLPLKDTRVDVAISGVIADVTVRQVYENRGERPLHARYIFPASTRAAVYGMTMTVGEVRIVARIKEREKAKREFERAKRDGKSASLLEESRPNVFTMNVANVLPGDTISVELEYTELLVPTEGAYEFVYPTVVGPRYSAKRESQASPGDEFINAPYTHQGEAPRSEFHLTGVVSTGMPIQELVSPSHQLVFHSSGQGRAEIALADAERFSGNRDFILRYRLAGEKIGSGLLLYQGRDENFFLLMAEPPQAVATDDVPAREYIFVVDVSGSMNGFPLDTGKKLMGDLVNVLRPSDVFNIVVFADGTETFSPVSVPATRPHLTRALQFIGRKDGGGGTRLLAALKRAVAIPREPAVSRSIVLLTDGYIEAEMDVFDYVRNQLHEANFFAFGIGSSVNRYLIEGVAHAGLGEPFVVTEPAEAAEAAAQLRRYIDSPALTGHRRGVLGIRRVRRRAEENPGPVREPSDCRLRKMARRRRGIDRDLGEDGSRRVPDIDCRHARELRHEAWRPSASLGANAHREPGRFRSRCSTRRKGGRDHITGTDLWFAHAVHLVRCGARDRAAHRWRRRRRRPAAAASGGRFGSRRRRDEWGRTGLRVGVGDRSGVVRVCEPAAREASPFGMFGPAPSAVEGPAPSAVEGVLTRPKTSTDTCPSRRKFCTAASCSASLFTNGSAVLAAANRCDRTFPSFAAGSREATSGI